MKPTLSRRSRVSCFSWSLERSVSPMNTCPLVIRSRPARQCIRVDLPEPDGPMMAVNWPAGRSTETPSRARTAVSPCPYTLTRSTALAAKRVRWLSISDELTSSPLLDGRGPQPTSLLLLPGAGSARALTRLGRRADTPDTELTRRHSPRSGSLGKGRPGLDVIRPPAH